mmetsp:Transcript_4357/g.10920  ORF Transcript_4357/g.10920 Transcript_4357/m.10920 type:complete len:204 (-) Transcript_4357:13-624(-)
MVASSSTELVASGACVSVGSSTSSTKPALRSALAAVSERDRWLMTPKACSLNLEQHSLRVSMLPSTCTNRFAPRSLLAARLFTSLTASTSSFILETTAARRPGTDEIEWHTASERAAAACPSVLAAACAMALMTGLLSSLHPMNLLREARAFWLETSCNLESMPLIARKSEPSSTISTSPSPIRCASSSMRFASMRPRSTAAP